MNAKSGLPCGGCKASVSLNWANVISGDRGLVNNIIQEAIPCHRTSATVSHSFATAASLGLLWCEGLLLFNCLCVVARNNLGHVRHSDTEIFIMELHEKYFSAASLIVCGTSPS